MKLNFASKCDIENIQVKVTEEITKKNLKFFLKTQIKLNNITLNRNSRILYFFIKEALIYEIFIINSKANFIIPQIYNLLDLKTGFNLIISKEYFAIFKNKELYCFKINKNYSLEDIKKYITIVYKIAIDNIIILDDDDKLKNNFLKKPNRLNYIIFYKINYQNVLFLVLIGALLLVFNLPNNNFKIVKYKNYKYRYYSKKLTKFFSFLKLNKLQIIALKIKQSKIYFIIIAKNRDDFYKFLKISNFKIKLKYIKQKNEKFEISGYIK